MVQAVTETNPKALQILLGRGVSHLSCCGDLNPNNVKISSKTTFIFFNKNLPLKQFLAVCAELLKVG